MIFFIFVLGPELFTSLIRIYKIMVKKLGSRAGGCFWAVYQILGVYQTNQKGYGL